MLTGNLSGRVQSLSSQVSELQAKLAKLDDITSKVDDVASRLTVVESEASEFRKVAFRYVIGEVHQKIQASLGTKAEGQLWGEYLEDKFSSQRAWFAQRNLGFAELDLLSKGPGTHYEAGNLAAHRPQPAAVSRIVGEGSESWRRLWDVACS